MIRTAATSLMVLFAISLSAPASAGPQAGFHAPGLVQAQFDDDDRRHWRGDRNGRHWRGHRGYRHHRRGYRYHDGFWFPPAAFLGGAIVGGAIASGRAAASDGAHYAWCEDRYRSYRRSDNTFQPYEGPRRQCRSPY